MAHSYLFCGLPMSGKSTLARFLAEKHSGSFIDLDRKVEELYLLETGQRLSCREIFLLEGSSAFRKRESEALERLESEALERLESEALERLESAPLRFIALGGGTLEEPSSRQKVQELGELIYLKESVELLWSRLSSRPLPAYLDPTCPKESFFALAAAREPLYEKEAGRTLNLQGRSPEMIVKEFFDGL